MSSIEGFLARYREGEDIVKHLTALAHEVSAGTKQFSGVYKGWDKTNVSRTFSLLAVNEQGLDISLRVMEKRFGIDRSQYVFDMELADYINRAYVYTAIKSNMPTGYKHDDASTILKIGGNVLKQIRIRLNQRLPDALSGTTHPYAIMRIFDMVEQTIALDPELLLDFDQRDLMIFKLANYAAVIDLRDRINVFLAA